MAQKPLVNPRCRRPSPHVTALSNYVCRKKFERVYQFKVVLLDIQPTIWRRIQVPDVYSFWELHCAITDSFGWLDYHLHEFLLKQPDAVEPEHIGIPDDEGVVDYDVLPGWKIPIAFYISADTPPIVYHYDFGDDWKHAVIVERILLRESGVTYPRCIAGDRACPPEDVGGPHGYERFLKSIRNPDDPEHDDYLRWCGGWFEPEWFDLALIRFGSPTKRFNTAFRERPLPGNTRKVQYHMLRASV